MVTLSSSGTQTAVIGTEHVLYNPTTFKYFTGYVDLTNLTANDIVEIRVYLIVKTAGSYIQYFVGTYTGVQTNPLLYLPTLPSDIGWKLTLKQTVGTGRTFDYKVFEI